MAEHRSTVGSSRRAVACALLVAALIASCGEDGTDTAPAGLQPQRPEIDDAERPSAHTTDTTAPSAGPAHEPASEGVILPDSPDNDDNPGSGDRPAGDSPDDAAASSGPAASVVWPALEASLGAWVGDEVRSLGWAAPNATAAAELSRCLKTAFMEALPTEVLDAVDFQIRGWDHLGHALSLTAEPEHAESLYQAARGCFDFGSDAYRQAFNKAVDAEIPFQFRRCYSDPAPTEESNKRFVVVDVFGYLDSQQDLRDYPREGHEPQQACMTEVMSGLWDTYSMDSLELTPGGRRCMAETLDFARLAAASVAAYLHEPMTADAQSHIWDAAEECLADDDQDRLAGMIPRAPR